MVVGLGRGGDVDVTLGTRCLEIETAQQEQQLFLFSGQTDSTTGKSLTQSSLRDDANISSSLFYE